MSTIVRKKYIGLGLLFLLIAVVVPMFVFAASERDITFPIPELGGCVNEEACKTYCDDENNIRACIDFAERHNLLSSEEIDEARKFERVRDVVNGPGGCTTPQSCEAYCNNIAHVDECLAYAEEHGVLEEGDLEEARKVQQALRSGAALPGGCTTKEECENYCDDPINAEECFAFAEAAGFIAPEEIEGARQAMRIIAEGRGPGDCTSERECRAYCDDEAHFEECFAFAEEAGFVTGEEAERFRKTGGKGPGGCVRDECETYCEDPAHQDECIDFAVEHGFISEEEAENVRKGGFGSDFEGPGGCTGKEECEAFCSQEENQQTCSEFFGESSHPRSDEAFKDEFEGGHSVFDQIPPEVRSCVEEALGADAEKLKQGDPRAFAQTLEPVIRRCFENQFEQEFPDEVNRHDGEGDAPQFNGPVFEHTREFDERRDEFEQRHPDEFKKFEENQEDFFDEQRRGGDERNDSAGDTQSFRLQTYLEQAAAVILNFFLPR